MPFIGFLTARQGGCSKLTSHSQAECGEGGATRSPFRRTDMDEKEEHANPFWREQDALVTDKDIKQNEKFEKIQNAWSRVFRPIVDFGNMKMVEKAEKEFAEYEAMVREGKADRWGEVECNWEDFLQVAKGYEKSTNQFEDRYYRMVPRFSEVTRRVTLRKEYRFWGKAAVFKIYKNGRRPEGERDTSKILWCNL
jgi:hypothetical protein